MATYSKRGGKVRAEVRRRGVYESQTFDTKREAEAWATRLEADILARDRGQVATGHSAREMLKRYSAEVSIKHRGKRWEQIRLLAFERDVPWIGKAVDKVRPDDVGKWRDARLLKVSASTVKRELGLLSAVFEFARVEWHWTAVNPLADTWRPSEAPHRERTVTPAEWRALCRAVDWRPGQMPQSQRAWAVAAFCLATRTAMRAGEVLSMHWKPGTRIAHLAMTKNGKGRAVPLSRQALRILDGLTLPFPMTSWQLDALFRQARGLAMIEGLRFHDSRHTGTTMLAKKLPNVMDLARVTGHRDLKMLLRYYNPSAESLADRLR